MAAIVISGHRPLKIVVLVGMNRYVNGISIKFVGRRQNMLACAYLGEYYRIIDQLSWPTSAVLHINLGHAVATGTGLKYPKGSKTGLNSRKYFLITKYPILRILYFRKAGELYNIPFSHLFFLYVFS